VLCTGGLVKRKAAEDTTQLYDNTDTFETGMYYVAQHKKTTGHKI